MNKTEVKNIISEVKKGSSKGFDLIYDDFSPALFGICLKIVKDSKVAEDVLQESFSKIWKNIDSYDDNKGSFFTWVLNITRNTAIDELRSLKRTPTFEAENETSLFKSGDNNTTKTNHIGLDDIIETLPKNEKIIIEYLFYKGYTQQEVSDEFNIPLGTVKSRSRKALGSLKKMFTMLLTWI